MEGLADKEDGEGQSMVVNFIWPAIKASRRVVADEDGAGNGVGHKARCVGEDGDSAGGSKVTG